MLVEPGPIGRYGFDAIQDHFGHPLPAEELYDLRDDPWELTNVASIPTHRETLDDLRKRLTQWMEFTHDPILSGDVFNPEPGKTLAEWWVKRDGRFVLREPAPEEQGVLRP